MPFFFQNQLPDTTIALGSVSSKKYAQQKVQSCPISHPSYDQPTTAPWHDLKADDWPTKDANAAFGLTSLKATNSPLLHIRIRPSTAIYPSEIAWKNH
jgi:hypothetical protein